MLGVETQVGTEQKILPHRQSAHQDIVLEAYRVLSLGAGSIILSKDVCACLYSVYLNHIGRAEPELGRDGSAIHQDFSVLQSRGVFSASDDVQEAGRKRNNVNDTDVAGAADRASVFAWTWTSYLRCFTASSGAHDGVHPRPHDATATTNQNMNSV